MRQLRNVTIGADPELFIVNKKTGKVVSSIGLIPGEKNNAYTEGMPEGFGLQIDNILGEFNIPPVPFNRLNDFVKHVEFMKEFISKYVKKINPDLDVLCKASMHVDEDQLNSEEAQLFGCDPDYNVYTMSENPKPEGQSTNLRTAGCHIHVGYDANNTKTSCALVKYMDAVLGLSSLLIDNDDERRQLYGKAGCFRLTSYGVEYRVLSGYMISSKKILTTLATLIKFTVDIFNAGYSIPPDFVLQNTIDKNDKVTARKLIKQYFGITHLINYLNSVLDEDKIIINEEIIEF